MSQACCSLAFDYIDATAEGAILRALGINTEKRVLVYMTVELCQETLQSSITNLSGPQNWLGPFAKPSGKTLPMHRKFLARALPDRLQTLAQPIKTM